MSTKSCSSSMVQDFAGIAAAALVSGEVAHRLKPSGHCFCAAVHIAGVPSAERGDAVWGSSDFLQVMSEATRAQTRSVRVMTISFRRGAQLYDRSLPANALKEEGLEADVDRQAAGFAFDLEIRDVRERPEQIRLGHVARGFPFLVQRKGMWALAHEAERL